MCRSWLNLEWHKSRSSSPVNNHVQVTLWLDSSGRVIHNILGRQKILVTRWYSVPNLGPMWNNICHIVQHILCNIQKLYIMDLTCAKAISITFHLKLICLALFNTPEQNRTQNTSAIHSVAIVECTTFSLNLMNPGKVSHLNK